MEGFRVEWRFSTPLVVPERPIHLDALLASAKVEGHLRAGKPLSIALLAQENLPLEKALGPDGEWVWKASQLLFSPSSPPLNVAMTRRVDVEAMAADRDHVVTTRKRKVQIGFGRFRHYDERLPIQWMHGAEAYGIGGIEPVRQLLHTISSLGRLRRNGWGIVHSVAVMPVPATAVYCWKKRTLPFSLRSLALEHHQPAQGNCRPPYWDRAKWQHVLEWVES